VIVLAIDAIGLAILCDQHSHRRLRDTRLVAELAGRGLKVDYQSVWGFVHAEKFSFNQKACWLANATVPAWLGGELSGQSTKVASKLSGWFSSTKPGPEQTWRPCGDGPCAVQTSR
jgi:hypothetical protein